MNNQQVYNRLNPAYWLVGSRGRFKVFIPRLYSQLFLNSLADNVGRVGFIYTQRTIPLLSYPTLHFIKYNKESDK